MRNVKSTKHGPQPLDAKHLADSSSILCAGDSLLVNTRTKQNPLSLHAQIINNVDVQSILSVRQSSQIVLGQNGTLPLIQLYILQDIQKD